MLWGRLEMQTFEDHSNMIAGSPFLAQSVMPIRKNITRIFMRSISGAVAESGPHPDEASRKRPRSEPSYGDELPVASPGRPKHASVNMH